MGARAHGRGAYLEALESRILLAATLLPIANHADLIFDSSRNVLDITATDGNIYRYSLASQQMLAPISVGAGLSLGYGDITPDGQYLYVTDTSTGTLHKINLVTSAVSNVSAGISYVQDVAIFSDTSALISGTQNPGAIYTLDLSTDTVAPATGALANQPWSLLFMPADRSGVLISNNDNGLQHSYYDLATNSITATGSYSFGSWALSIEAVSRDGELSATTDRSKGVTYVDDLKGGATHMALPGGAAYFSPVYNTLYLLRNQTHTLEAYDTTTFQRKAVYDIGDYYDYSNTQKPNTGLMTASADGKTLFVATDAGIRVVNVDESQLGGVSLGASSASILAGQSVTLTANVTGAGSAGTVTFMDGTLTLASIPVSGDGIVSQPFSGLSAGVHTLVATFTPAAGSDGSAASQLVAVVVRQDASSILPIAHHYGLIYDPTRNQLLIPSDNGTIFRFDETTNTFLPALQITGDAGAGDITPDGNYLYLSDRNANKIHKVDLNTGAETVLSYNVWASVDSYGTGVVIISNSLAYLAGFQIDLADDAITTIPAGPLQGSSAGTAFFRSNDRTTMLRDELGSSDDPISLFSVASNSILGTGNVSFGSWRNWIASVSRDGTYVATTDRSSNTTELRNQQLSSLTTFPGGATLFSPTADILFVYENGSSMVRAYSTTTQSLLGSFQAGETYSFGDTSQGVMAASADGKTLFVATTAGVRVLDVGHIAAMSPFTASTIGTSASFTLSITNLDGSAATDYRGTVHFSSSEAAALLPADYTFTAADAGSHTFTFTPRSGGTYTLTATDTSNSGVAASGTYTVQKLSAPLAVTGSAVNGHLVLTANFNLSGLPQGYTPPGNVTFSDGANHVLGVVTLGNGSGSLVTNLTPSVNTLSVSYAGDTSFVPQQVAGTLTLPAETTYLDIAAPSQQIFAPATTIKTRVLDILGDPVETGTVTLHLVLAGTSTVLDIPASTFDSEGYSTFVIPSLDVGDWQISASFVHPYYYAGATVGPVSLLITKASPSITLVKSNGMIVATLANFAAPPNSALTFRDGSTVLGSVPLSSQQASYSLGLLSVGAHSITASLDASGNWNAAASAPLAVSIVPPATATTLTLRSGAPAPSAGQSIQLIANVTPGASGSVSFMDGGNVLGSAAVNATGVATLTAALSAGTHYLQANFIPTNNYSASSAPVLILPVTQPTVVDILGLYTSTVLSAAGGFGNVLSYIRKEVANTNQAFANSGVALTLRLVSLSFVSYTESGVMGTDLSRLDTSNDGYMDNVQSLRDAVGADLVVLIDAHITHEDADPNVYTSGIGDTLLNLNSPMRDQTAYMVIAEDDPQGDYLLAHEVAHTFGATHAIGDPTDTGATPYAHGYRFIGSDNQQYHDIMAYDPGTEIPYYSNPNILYKGQAIGNAATADVARLLREQAPRMAAYRTAGIIGGVDVATATTLGGWFLDTRAFDSALMMRVEIDGITRAVFSANLTRSDLNAAFGATNHGFLYTLPVLLGGTHKIVLYAQDAPSGTFVLMATRTITTITPLFDENYYLKNNPDVANAVKLHLFASGYDHFIKSGQFEGRNPSPYFDTKYYLAHNPDLAAAAAKGQLPSPFSHYLLRGQYEGRLASPYFNERYYRLAYPDVAAAIKAGVVKDGLEHFLQFGQFEGRSPIPYFDAAYYLSNNPSVTGSAYADFVYRGNAAGLAPSAYFDPATYLSLNPDVAALISSKQYTSALDHYLRAGRAQGRPFSTTFSEASYLAKNPDVAAAVAAGVFSCGFEHWLLAGRFENRPL